MGTLYTYPFPNANIVFQKSAYFREDFVKKSGRAISGPTAGFLAILWN